jgi:hypothetical protein
MSFNNGLANGEPNPHTLPGSSARCNLTLVSADPTMTPSTAVAIGVRKSASVRGRSIIGRSGSVDADQTAWNAWLIKVVSMVVGK